MTGPSPAPGSSGSQLYFNGVVAGNGADTTIDTLMSFTIPAATLVNLGDTITISAGGSFAASTDTKVARVSFGGISLGGPTGNTASTTKWTIRVQVSKTGASTQAYIITGSVANGTVSGTNSNTLSITDTSTIAVLVTGQNSTNAVQNSVTCQYLSISYSSGN